MLRRSGEKPDLWKDWERDLGTRLSDERPAVLQGLRETLLTVACAVATLPEGQKIRPEWPKRLGELALTFQVERSKWHEEETKRAMEEARNR